MTKEQNITLIKSLLRKHSEFTELWHDASFGDNQDPDDAEEYADQLSKLELDITFIAGDIFLGEGS